MSRVLPGSDWLDDRPAFDRAHARSRALARAWAENPGLAVVAETFTGIAADDPAAAVRAARALLERDDWIGPLLAPLIAALAAERAFEPPLRVARDPLRTGAVLFECPVATIGASVLHADALAALPPPTTVMVPGRLSVVRYIRGGGARLRLWHAPRDDRAGEQRCRPLGVLPVGDGVVLTIDGRTRGFVLEGARDDVVMLTATIGPGGTGRMREFAIADGQLVRTATHDEGASRTHMLLTLLRLSNRADAGACFDAATRDAAFHLRWAAMREWLALDARAARARLAEMAANDPEEEVRDAARRTLPLVDARLAPQVEARPRCHG